MVQACRGVSAAQMKDRTAKLKVIDEPIDYDHFCRIMPSLRYGLGFRGVMLKTFMQELEFGEAFLDVIDRMRRKMKNYAMPKNRSAPMEYKSLPHDTPLYLYFPPKHPGGVLKG